MLNIEVETINAFTGENFSANEVFFENDCIVIRKKDMAEVYIELGDNIYREIVKNKRLNHLKRTSPNIWL